MALGFGYVGLKKETTFGTAATVAEFIPVKSFEPAQDPQNYYPEAIRGTRGRVRGIGMGIQNEVSMEMDAEPQSIGHILLAALGTVSSAAVSGVTGAFTHTITPGNTLPSYTFEKNDTVMTQTIAGTKIDSLTLSVEAGDDGVLSVEADMIAQSITDKAAASTATYTDKDPFVFHRVTVEKGGTVNENLKSLELEINNNLKDDQFTLRKSRNVATIEEGMREVKVTSEMLFKNKAEYQAFINGTKDSLKFSFEGDIISGTTRDLLVIELPKVLYDSFEVPMGGPDDEVLASIEATALIDTTAGFEIKATLTNSVTSY